MIKRLTGGKNQLSHAIHIEDWGTRSFHVILYKQTFHWLEKQLEGRRKI